MKRFEQVSPWLMVLLFSACSVGDEAAVDIPEGRGGLRVSLESADPILAGMTGHILVSRHGSDEIEVDREFDPMGGARALDVIYLDEGVYDVLVQVVVDGGQVALEGEASSVTVALGVLTSVFIQLEESGGMQVGVEYPDLGSRFVVADEIGLFLDSVGRAAIYANLVGTQRLAADPSESRYFVVGRQSFSKVLNFHSSDRPSQLVNNRGVQITEAIQLPDPREQIPIAMAEAGGYLYLLTQHRLGGNIHVLRSIDGLDWEILTSIQLVQTGSHWLSRDCSLIVDNQFNLFCIVTDERNDPFGVAHAFSSDGELWSDLLPFIDETLDSTIELNWPRNISTDDPDYPRILVSWRMSGLHMVGGTSSIWFCVNYSNFDFDIGRYMAAEYTYRLTSLDREHWSGPSLLSLDPVTDALSGSGNLRIGGFVVFRTNDGIEAIATDVFTGRVLWLTEE